MFTYGTCIIPDNRYQRAILSKTMCSNAFMESFHPSQVRASFSTFLLSGLNRTEDQACLPLYLIIDISVCVQFSCLPRHQRPVAGRPWVYPPPCQHSLAFSRFFAPMPQSPSSSSNFRAQSSSLLSSRINHHFPVLRLLLEMKSTPTMRLTRGQRPQSPNNLLSRRRHRLLLRLCLPRAPTFLQTVPQTLLHHSSRSS